MIFRTDNPLADFDRYDSEYESYLESLPKCDDCGEPIQDDYLYIINDEILCEDCLNRTYRKSVEVYNYDN